MLRTALRLTALAACLLAATVALAHTEQGLTEVATALEADYQDFQHRLDLDNEPHSQLEADFAILENRRTTLQQDRATLVGCGCSSLDARIGGIVRASDLAKATMGGWDET